MYIDIYICVYVYVYVYEYVYVYICIYITSNENTGQAFLRIGSWWWLPKRN